MRKSQSSKLDIEKPIKIAIEPSKVYQNTFDDHSTNEKNVPNQPMNTLESEQVKVKENIL